ncbi:MAG: hypothetical protein IJR60_01795 [Eubacterium sp.]|nr:hypothetical protein [Eubacterium sp.]
MPYVDLKTNKPLTGEVIEQVKSDLGNAICAIPGKSEAWLMVRVEGDSNMFFKGSGDDCAMFDVSIFGSASDSAYDNLTQRICKISEERLGVPAARTYVKYSEYAHWGWNNMNF